MSILDLFYPKRCVGCKKEGTYFCPACIRSSKLHFPQVCPVCERASLDGITHKKCRKRITPDGLFCVWTYEGAPRKLVSKLKYKFASNLALGIASAATGILKTWQRSTPLAPNWSREEFLLVPIPLHWARRNWRGFNQSEEVGKLLAQFMGWKVARLLNRWYTRPQVGLSQKERLENIQDAFVLSPDSPVSPASLAGGRHPDILLFDDVWTTGSTLLEATRILKEAGVKRVWCLTIAR